MLKRQIIVTMFIICGISLHAQTYMRPSISRVLVDPATNYVQIYYTGTDHPDVTHYKISQWMITGNNPIASGVPIESSSTPHTGAAGYYWTDYIEQVENEPVGFTVGAYNSSDEPINQSYPPDSTIHLAVTYDSCSASVSLRWNDYNAWRGNIRQYEIVGSNADGSYSVLAIIHEGTTDTIITGLQANNQYLFYIEARKNSTSPDDFVTSNGVRFSTPHARYPEFIYADFGTVDSDNNPHLRFTIDPLSELSRYNLSRAENPAGPYNIIDSINLAGSVFDYTDASADASTGPYYYTLTAINFCDQAIATSENIAGTIYLTDQAGGNLVNLEWTPYYEWPSGIAVYDIERNLSDEGYQLLNETHFTSFTDNSFPDLAGQQVSSEVCYRITARENPGGTHSVSPAASTSNILCVHLPTHVRFDYNAFVPDLDGFESFGPTMDFLPGYFNFKIFNRAGTKVFESTDPENPNWDGHYNHGSIVPEGIYRYQLEYEDETGNRVVINGKVSVVRQ
jgi:hypothetical protein